MRPLRLFFCIIAILLSKEASWGTDYTGIWKKECSDYYGIQIKPVENQFYSVSFCGLESCFEPGEWTPKTRIEGDSQYKVISSSELGIKRKDGDGYFTYRKCTGDPTWIVAQPLITEPRIPPDCSFATNSTEKGVLIAWITDVRETTQFGGDYKTQTTTVKPFRPFALLDGTTLKETSGATIRKGQSFWRVLSPLSKPIRLASVSSFLDHMNEDHCVYFATLGKASVPQWTLLSSKPLPGVFRVPSSKDMDEFYRLNTTCVQQGDYPEGQEPPCVRPKLLAVTDFNKNGKPEYWATAPYLWDTGLTVWENNKGVLLPLIQVCQGCSD